MADEVLIPVVPKMWDISGVQDYEAIVSKIKEERNSKLKISGILLTMCEGEVSVPCDLPIFQTGIPNAYKELAKELETC